MVDFTSTMVYNSKKTSPIDRGYAMDNITTERDTDREIFALYARAVAAFQLGGRTSSLGGRESPGGLGASGCPA